MNFFQKVEKNEKVEKISKSCKYFFFENSKTFKIFKNGTKYHHFTVYNIHIELEMKKYNY